MIGEGNLLDDALWNDFKARFAAAGGHLFVAARGYDSTLAADTVLQAKALALYQVTQEYVAFFPGAADPVDEPEPGNLWQHIRAGLLLAALARNNDYLREAAREVRRLWPMGQPEPPA